MKPPKTIDSDLDPLYDPAEARMFRRALKAFLLFVAFCAIVGAIE